jgi:hypothetical protein
MGLIRTSFYSAFAATVLATSIKVQNPISLKSKFGDIGDIQSHLGNYGHIQYGQQFVGELQYPTTNRNGCSRFLLSDFDRLSKIPSEMEFDDK